VLLTSYWIAFGYSVSSYSHRLVRFASKVVNRNRDSFDNDEENTDQAKHKQQQDQHLQQDHILETVPKVSFSHLPIYYEPDEEMARKGAGGVGGGGRGGFDIRYVSSFSPFLTPAESSSF
jgi:hypothetical protein